MPCSLGITLHHQGNLTEAAARLREAMDLQAAPELATDRAWTMHALAAVERDRARLAEALDLLAESLVLHRAGESVHGEAWAHFQLGQAGPADGRRPARGTGTAHRPRSVRPHPRRPSARPGP
ncbi:hypothetical protein SALBM311S_03391 [Streptomyces alboniger]